MSISEFTRPFHAPSPTPLAWPVVGGKGVAAREIGGIDDDVRALQAIGTKARIARNQAIFRQGEKADCVYKVVSGVVRLCRHMSGGRRPIVQFSYPGDFFSILDDQTHSFTAEAVSDCVVMSYPNSAIAVLGEQRPSVRRRFATLMVQRLREMENHLAVLGRQTAKERVISFLLALRERIGMDEDDLVDVPMIRQDMADYLGLTNETVCRVVAELKRAGLIDTPNNRQFILNDTEALEALAEGDEDVTPWKRTQGAARSHTPHLAAAA
jgi:CRP/FNR family nitrogen fixation transcriptional regulator